MTVLFAVIDVGINGSPEIGELQAEDNIRFCYQRLSPSLLIQMMRIGNVHSTALIDYWRL